MSLRVVFTARFENYVSNAEQRVRSTPVAKLLSEAPRNGLSPTTNSDELGLQTISISAVSNGRFDPTGHIKYAEVEHDKASQFFVKSGDVFAIRGNGNRYITGTVGIAERDYEELFYPDLLIRMRFDHEQVLPRFALAQWNLPSVHRRLVARAKSSNGIYKVNGQDIRAHTLLVPSLQEQQRVLEELDAIEMQREKCESRRVSASNLRAAVLQRLEGKRDA